MLLRRPRTNRADNEAVGRVELNWLFGHGAIPKRELNHIATTCGLTLAGYHRDDGKDLVGRIGRFSPPEKVRGASLSDGRSDQSSPESSAFGKGFSKRWSFRTCSAISSRNRLISPRSKIIVSLLSSGPYFCPQGPGFASRSRLGCRSMF